MIRNIIGQKRSYTITLPKNWVEKRGLKQGDSVKLEEDGDFLILTSEQKHSQKEINVVLEGDDEQFLRTTFLNIYSRGYDRIILNYHNSLQRDIIKNTLSDYVFGFEIISDDKYKLIVESISEPSSDKYSIILRKVFLNINELLVRFSKSLSADDKLLDEDFKTIYKYVNFCKRELNRNKIFQENVLFESGLITYLSIIQRSLFHLNKHAKDYELSEELESYFVKIQSIFHDFYEGFIKKDFKLLSRTNDKVKEFHYELLNSKFIKDEPIFAYYLLEISRTINRAINISRGIVS